MCPSLPQQHDVQLSPWCQLPSVIEYVLSAVLLLLQVESKSIPDIARDLVHLQQLAAAGKLSSHDVTGGSITISNIGGYMYMYHPHCIESARCYPPAHMSLCDALCITAASADSTGANSCRTYTHIHGLSSWGTWLLSLRHLSVW